MGFKVCVIIFSLFQVEDLKAKLASQEAELTFKNQNIEALITKIGLQTERVSSKREAADVEAQKVRYHVNNNLVCSSRVV